MTSKAEMMEMMQQEAAAEQAAADAQTMETMQKEAAEEQIADDAVHETETPMEKMQREALEEQAATDGGDAAAMSMEAMQQAAVAEQSSSDTTARQSRDIKELLHRYLFNMNSHGGKVTNYSILTLIVTSVFLSMFNTLPEVHREWEEKIFSFQMFILYIFLFEYLLRIYAAKNRLKYMFGFYGIIDFLTVLPLAFGNPGSAIMRLCRLFRILNLASYFPVLATLLRSVSGAMNMILAVLATIAAVSVFSGNLAYMIEPETFRNAFIGTWWSLVTMSTVGYGDLVPHTAAGMALGGALILIGVCVVAMMTAVIAVRVGRMVNMTNKCFECEKPVSSEFSFCPHCGQDQSDEIDLFTDDE